MSIFWIKIIASISMLLDHTGMILFPDVLWLRILGRVALPLYALCIAEGFRHTRSRGKYFLRIFILGVLCQIVYDFVSTDVYLGILITFSLSIVLLTLIDALICACKEQKNPVTDLLEKLLKRSLSRPVRITLCAILLTLASGGILALNHFFTVDYGLTGILLPVLIYLGGSSRWGKLGGAAAGTAMLACNLEGAPTPRIWSLLALAPLALYNGEPGKYKLKYFFYVFYPAHLVLLYGIAMLTLLLRQ
ncbi:MAG: hypothetical protein IIX86_00230 [Clostridia bacterium]|nr:hypothetical protein [Clostridia bacterium]